MSDQCGKAWDRMSLEYGRATDGAGNQEAYCRARRNLARCISEHTGVTEFLEPDGEPFACEEGGQ